MSMPINFAYSSASTRLDSTPRLTSSRPCCFQIGRGARSTVRTVDTGGGNYAEGNIDKRRGTFVSGDQFNMSGNFSGAILNIKATLIDVSQRIGAVTHDDATTKAHLQTTPGQARLAHRTVRQTSASPSPGLQIVQRHSMAAYLISLHQIVLMAASFCSQVWSQMGHHGTIWVVAIRH